MRRMLNAATHHSAEPSLTPDFTSEPRLEYHLQLLAESVSALSCTVRDYRIILLMATPSRPSRDEIKARSVYSTQKALAQLIVAQSRWLKSAQSQISNWSTV